MIGPHGWLVGGLVLCALELVAPGVFLLPIGLGACVTGLVGLATPLLPWTAVLLFAGSAAALAFSMRRTRRAADTVNAAATGVVGELCQALAFQAGQGRVRLRDGTWAARVAAGPDPAEGDWVRVVGLDGTVLLVGPG